MTFIEASLAHLIGLSPEPLKSSSCSPRTPIYTDMSRRRLSPLDTARLSIFTTALAIVVGVAAIAISGFTGVTGGVGLAILVAGVASIPGDRRLLRIGRASEQDSP